MELTKTKRNFLVTLLSFMVGMIYFIPYIRISFYDQTIAALAFVFFPSSVKAEKKEATQKMAVIAGTVLLSAISGIMKGVRRLSF